LPGGCPDYIQTIENLIATCRRQNRALQQGAFAMSDDEKRERIEVISPWIQSSIKDVSAAPRRVTSLPSEPVPSSDTEQTIPRWSRILLALAPAIAVLSRPDIAEAALPPVQRISVVVPTDDDTQHFNQTVRQFADEAIAANTSTASNKEKHEEDAAEFRSKFADAFREARSVSADLAKDIGKDLAKDAVEFFLMGSLWRFIVKHLRRCPNNPIAKSTADNLEAFAKHRDEHPKEPVSPKVVVLVVGCTPVQAESTLHLAGYEAHGDGWFIVREINRWTREDSDG
jgi:hypothetical protein